MNKKSKKKSDKFDLRYKIKKSRRFDHVLEKDQTRSNIFWIAVVPFFIALFSAVLLKLYDYRCNRPHVTYYIQQISSDELTGKFLQSANIYLNNKLVSKGNHRSKQKSIKLNPSRLNVVGVENIKSKNDSILFQIEKRQVAKLLKAAKRSKAIELDKSRFVFHRIFLPEDFDYRSTLFFGSRQPAPKKEPLFFISDSSELSYVLEEPLIQYTIRDKDSLASLLRTELYDSLDYVYRYTEYFSKIIKNAYKDRFKIEFPEYEEINWYSRRGFEIRSSYSQNIREMLRASVYLLPSVYQYSENECRAGFIMSLAPLGDLKFEPIPVNNCIIEPEPDTFMKIGHKDNLSLFDLIELYSEIYKSFIQLGRIDSIRVDNFIKICSDNFPDIGYLELTDGDQIVRVMSEAEPRDIRPERKRRKRQPNNDDYSVDSNSREEESVNSTSTSVTNWTIRSSDSSLISDSRIKALNNLLDERDCTDLYNILNAFWVTDRLRGKNLLDYENPIHKDFITNSVKCVRSLLLPVNRCPEPAPSMENVKNVASALIYSINFNYSIPRRERDILIENIRKDMYK
ncbi:MAG: hypothetical protein JXI43_10700 [Tissierellales bacterium]|nr:hypothetical protein [Tissierellales bacterium]